MNGPARDAARRQDSTAPERLPQADGERHGERPLLDLHRRAGNRAVGTLLADEDQVRPLPAGLRRIFEGQLGADLSRVRVHDGPQASRHTKREGAAAFTRGSDIFLGASVDDGDPSVLAHEVAHVVQQTTPGTHGAPASLEAEAAAVGAGAAPSLGSAPFGAIQRLWPLDEEEPKKEGFPPGWVQEVMIPDLKRDKERWKHYVDDPRTAKILRDNAHWFEGDTDYQAWRNDPQAWKADPRNQPPAPAASQGPRGAGAATAPGAGGETVTLTSPNVNVTYDDAAGRYVVTVEGTPIAAIEADRSTPLNVDVTTSGTKLGVNVTGGPHKVVPLGVGQQVAMQAGPPSSSERVPVPRQPGATGAGPAGGIRVPVSGSASEAAEQPVEGRATPEPESGGFTRSEVEPLLVKEAPRQKTQEELIKENWAKNATPRQKKEAAELPPPSIYYSPEMRKLDAPPEIFEAADLFLPFPAFTTGWKLPQVLTGETVSGKPVDRGKVAQEIGQDVVAAVVLDKAGEEVLGRLLPEEALQSAAHHSGGVGEDIHGGTTTTAEVLPPKEKLDLVPAPKPKPDIVPAAKTPPPVAAAPTVTPPSEPHAGAGAGAADDPLVVAKIEGKNKGEYWQEGSSEFKLHAGSSKTKTPPSQEYVVWPKSEAEARRFRPAGTDPDFTIEPMKVDGELRESRGAGYGSKHPVTGRTTRAEPGPGRPKKPSIAGRKLDPAAQHGFSQNIAPDLAQAEGYKNTILKLKEYGLKRPGNVSTGGVDAVTAGIEGDSAKIYLNDVTTPDARKMKKPTHADWAQEARQAIAADPKTGKSRLDLENKADEDKIRKAFADGEIYVRVVRVEIPPTGGKPIVTYETAVKVK